VRFLRILGLIVFIIIVIVLILGFFAPTSYEVTRKITIKAPDELVFRHIRYWSEWQNWSPWAEIDSTMIVSYEGKVGQVGSVYSWEGDPKLTGSGMMVNTGVTPYGEITYHLQFTEPWESESDGFFSLDEIEESTEVTWGHLGTMRFPWNVAALFMNVNKSLGGDFERGLKLLKTICEEEYEIFKQFTIKEIEYPTTKYAMIRKTIDFAEMGKFFEEAFSEIYQYLGMKTIKPLGAPAALYFSWDDQNKISDLAAAVPVKRDIKTDKIETLSLSYPKAVVADYYGPYEKLVHGHNALDLYFAQNELTYTGPGLEVYLSDPEKEPDSSKWLTKIYYFVAESD